MKGFAVSTATKSPADAAMVQSARERYESALQRYALRELGGAANLAKEILAEAWQELQSQTAAEIGEQAGEWLFLNCRRRIHANLSKGQAKHMDTGGPEGRGNATASLAEGDENEEPHVTMQRLIDRLTPKQQETIRLRFQNDFSVQAIARITELTVYNVGALVHNAVAKLGREYRAQHPDETGSERKGVGDDARLTLYALGEMEDAERKSFEDSLIDKKNAAVRVEEIRAVGALIGQALAVEAGAPAPHTVRKKKRSGLALWLSFPRVLLPVAGVVAAVLIIFFWWRKPEAPADGGPRERIDFRLKPAAWKEGDALPDEAQIKAGANEGMGRSPSLANLGSKAGTHVSPKQTSGRAVAGHKSIVPPVGRAVQAPAPADSQIPDADDSVAEESAPRQGGLPTGAVPTGVAAVLRGKSGEVPATTEADFSGIEGELKSTDEVTPARNEERTGAVAPVKPDAVKPEATERSGSQKKLTAPARKNKGEQKERVFAVAKDAGISWLPPDVAAATVGVLKKALARGRLPAPKAVRVEELLNYFPVASAAPEGSELFAATLEAAEAPWDPKHRLVRVSLKGREAPAPVRGAASLVLVVDISGSMAAPNRLPLVKEALRLLLGRLRPDDRVGVVTYAAEPKLALLPTPVAQLQEILQVFDRLEAQGPTNGAAGMELAYDLVKAHAVPGGRSCVIMCTDGDFNTGPTSEQELGKIIDRQAGSGVTLSIYGFGRGRQIDARLEALAVRGGGSSGYLNTRRDAERVLTGEINGIFEPLAKDLEVKVVFNPEQVEGYRLLGYDEPKEVAPGKIVEAPADRTVLPGHTVTALYEVIRKDGAPPGDLLSVQLDYQTPRDSAPHRQEFTLRDRGATFAQAGLDFKFAAAVGAFGLVLNEQAPAGVTLDTVADWAADCLGDDTGGYRSEFLALVEQARAIKQ